MKYNLLKSSYLNKSNGNSLPFYLLVCRTLQVYLLTKIIYHLKIELYTFR